MPCNKYLSELTDAGMGWSFFRDYPHSYSPCKHLDVNIYIIRTMKCRLSNLHADFGVIIADGKVRLQVQDLKQTVQYLTTNDGDLTIFLAGLPRPRPRPRRALNVWHVFNKQCKENITRTLA